MRGYYGRPEESSAVIDKEGFFHTGDLGRLSADGHLTLVGRSKDLIVTAGGKNIAPAPLELELTRHPLIANALVHGDRRRYLVAIATLDLEALEAELPTQTDWTNGVGTLWAKDELCVIRTPIVGEDFRIELWAKTGGSHREATQPGTLRIAAAVGHHLREMNLALASYQTLKALILSLDDFSVEGGELTPSLKLKRHVVEDRYTRILDAIFEEK